MLLIFDNFEQTFYRTQHHLPTTLSMTKQRLKRNKKITRSHSPAKDEMMNSKSSSSSASQAPSKEAAEKKRSVPQNQLRFGTWNVHQFTNGYSEDTFEDICDTLIEANLDMIGLQETTGFLLDELVEKLNSNNKNNKKNCKQGKNSNNNNHRYILAAKHGGTALVTRLSVVPGSTSKLGKGRYSSCRVALPSGCDDDAAAAGVSPLELGVVVLHLDHQNEKVRMEQTRTMIQTFLRKGLPLPDVWMGDFNALTKDDYTKAEWSEIADIRARNFWESPVTELTSALTSATSSKKQKSLLPTALCDSWSSCPHRTGPAATCRFGTRIDYIYYNDQRFHEAGLELVSCEHMGQAHVADGGKKGLSDHNLVVTTFKIKS